MQNKVVFSKIRLLKIVPHDNLNKSNKKEEEINELKQRKKTLSNHMEIDNKILNIWNQFIKFYNYDYYFTLSEKIFLSFFSFDLLSKLLYEDLNLYEENMNLISKDEIGSYVLQNSKIWIMYIKMKIEINKQTISDLFKIFQRALQYNANLLEMFTFFIIILTECKNIDDEIEKMNLIEYSKEVPEEFIQCWNINEENILKIIEKKEEIDSRKENKIIYGNSLSNNKIEFKKLSIIQESDIENENFKSPNQETAKKKMVKMNIIFNKKKKEKEKEKKLLKSLKLFRKNHFNLEDNLEDIKIIDSNVQNNGNYAIIELNKNLEKQIGHKIVITPIKPKISNSHSSASDIKDIEKKYGDIYYQPFDKSLIKKLKSQTEENDN
jgi:hypothetical protein